MRYQAAPRPGACQIHTQSWSIKHPSTIVGVETPTPNRLAFGSAMSGDRALAVGETAGEDRHPVLAGDVEDLALAVVSDAVEHEIDVATHMAAFLRAHALGQTAEIGD